MRGERYHPLVAEDMRKACREYDEISSQLGNRFRERIQSKIDAVIQRPESFGRIGGEFRGALVENFPYVVVFAIESGEVYIYGVRHAASDRQIWFNRRMPGNAG